MSFDLTGKLLISTPSMADPRFSHSVIYLCAHSEEGAFGLILNRPLTHLTLGDVFEQIGIGDEALPGERPELAATPVLSGGPVETQRGFVLHGPCDTEDSHAQALPDGLSLSASTEVLKAIAKGEGPRDWLLALGYSGWGPGQLEAELAQNAWLTASAPQALIFDRKPGGHQWNEALKSMGVDPLSLSPVSGRA